MNYSEKEIEEVLNKYKLTAKRMSDLSPASFLRKIK